MNIHDIELAIEKEVKYVEVRYRNLALFIISLVAALFLFKNFYLIENLISTLGEYGMLGIFIAGAGYTSTFTTVISSVVLYAFGEFYNPVLVASLGALGAVLTDAVMYFVTKKFFDRQIKHRKVKFQLPEHVLIKKLAPIIGFIIIGSPLPDEFGIAFLSLYEKNYRHFLVISYTANFLGILLLSALGSM